MVSSSGRRVSATPARSKTPSVRPLGKGSAQHLSSLAKGRANDGKELVFAHEVGIDAHLRSTSDRDEHRVDVRAGHEDGRRHLADDLRVREVLQTKRDRAVGLVARVRGESLAHFFLHHDEHARDERLRLEQVQHHGRRDVVGQVGDDDRGFDRQDLVVVRVQRVSVMDTHAQWLDDFAKRLDQVAVDFEGVHRRAGLGQGERKRSEPRANL